uniref:Uncharacterized protein n=1 Tax=Panagrolaimus davidi TaxID=227884 RepID=A0A914P164_9BILA
MNYEFANVKSSYKSDDVASCMPKIVGSDKMVKLFVDIEDGCSVTVTNAKIHVPPTPTPLPLTVPPPTQSSQKGSAEASSFPDWGYAVIGIVILIVILFIGFVVYYLYRKRQTSKRIPPNVDRKQPQSTKAKDTTHETPTKKDDDLEAAKTEPKKSQKKEKKAKTIEPTANEDIPAAAKIEPKKSQKKEKKTTPEPTTTEDIPAPTAKENLEAAKIQLKKIQKKEKKTTQEQTAEDIPAPTVKQPERAPTKQLPPPNPAACYPVVKRLIPRGMKSAKTDSLDETLKKDKTAMAESFVVSAGKLCLKSDEMDVLRKMESAYPQNIQHVVTPSEVNLLCMPVSKMFEKMDSMAQVSELKLSSAGCEFDDQYSEYISDDPGILNEASIPLLYVIALQTRFSEKSRRKACAILRRKLVKVLGYFKAADRAKMPFPVNIVEAAYCKDPKYFFDPTGIKTDSGSDGKRKNKSTKKH